MGGGKGIRFSTVAANVSRLVVAVCFVFSGFVKAVDPIGTQIKFQDYLEVAGAGPYVPDSLTLLAACVLAGLEFLLGIYLLLGVYRKGTAVVLLVMMSLFTPLTLWLAISNPVSDCGCFGDALVLTNWQTFFKNVFLLCLCIQLFVFRDRMVPLVGDGCSWAVTVLTAVLVSGFMCFNIRNLPVFDFRPYKVGTDLRASVLDGRDNEFSEFCLLDPDFSDVTGDILDSRGTTFLLVSPHLDDATTSAVDRINDLYGCCSDSLCSFYCVTASGADEVERWRNATYAEYGFLYADDILLKTMIRSNPGVVVVHDGRIAAKWSSAGIPQRKESGEYIVKLQETGADTGNGRRGAMLVACIFVLPYLLLVLTGGRARHDENRNKI